MIRLQFVAAKTRVGMHKGGMQATRTVENMTASTTTLLGRYPNYTQPNARRKTGCAEITLRDQTDARKKCKPAKAFNVGQYYAHET